MSENPFFTVGIPVYNTSKWVGACIESVLSQSFEDFELIILNDGSIDNSLDIISEYREKDSRIKVINRKNMGISAARNAIITNAAGKYINIIDSDDIMAANAMEKAQKRISETNYPDVLQCGIIKNVNGKEFYELPEKELNEKIKGKYRSKDERAVLIWTQGFFISHIASRYVKTEFMHNSGIASVTRYSAGEDGDFTLQLLRAAETIEYGNFFSNVYYRPREGSATTVMSYKVIRDKIVSWNAIFDDMQFWDLSDEIRQLGINNIGYLYNNRVVIVSSFGEGKSKEEAYRTAYMIDRLIGKKIRRLPLDNCPLNEKVIYMLFKLIGIRLTCHFIHLYFIIKNKFL